MVKFDAHRDVGKLDDIRLALGGQVFPIRKDPL